MGAITIPKTREIVDDFAKEILKRRSDGPKPSKEVINFRTELKTGRERPVFHVPIELLRYRKDNGRIASDVADYERTVGPIDERDDDGQAISAYETRLYDRILRRKDGWVKQKIQTHTRDTTGKDYDRTEILWKNGAFTKAKSSGKVPIVLTKKERFEKKLNPARPIRRR
jgi:hypothetical protein